MNTIEKKFLNKLLDKYEKSKKFNDSNKVNRKISLLVSKVYPAYLNESDYDTFVKINEAIEFLKREELVTLKAKDCVIEQIVLKEQNIDKCYKLINRQPKKQSNDNLLEILTGFENVNDVLADYITEQKQALKDNKAIKFYNGNLADYQKFLRAVQAVMNNQEEIYVREFSIKLFGDSKTFEHMESSIRSFLVNYAGEENLATVIENYNIVKNPTSIHIKGNAIIAINGEKINIKSLNGGIAISSLDLDKIDKVEILTSSVTTIENLTTFYTFKQDDSVSIYISGYPNSDKCEFIKKIFDDNKSLKYYHFGDIDAGGIEIFNTLCRKTSIDFIPYKMGIEQLEQYKSAWRTLTKLDVTRLNKLKCPNFNEVVDYMLKNNCKLEQEIIDV